MRIMVHVFLRAKWIHLFSFFVPVNFYSLILYVYLVYELIIGILLLQSVIVWVVTATCCVTRTVRRRQTDCEIDRV